MELKIKHYKELTLDELHDIYRYRVAVFVVEQNCPYQEVDGNDKVSWHMWLEDKGEMIAYLKTVFPTLL